MTDPFTSPGTDLPSPTLSARLRELSGYFAAPTAGRLTDEQRALALGIARRLVTDAATHLDPRIDATALWADWLQRGIPAAAVMAPLCFARAEEHRWRSQPMLRLQTPESDAAADSAETAEPTGPRDLDDAFLALRIADRRRFDAQGQPAVPLADLDANLARPLMLDIAAWQLGRLDADPALSAELGEAVRRALDTPPREEGIDAAAAAYSAKVGENAPTVAAAAIARHDWPVFIALAAVATGRRYSAMTLALLTANEGEVGAVLAPLAPGQGAIAHLEAALATLPARVLGGAPMRPVALEAAP